VVDVCFETVAVKSNTLDVPLATWADPKTIILSRKSKKQKDT
jgi:hypothetical protein